MQLQNLRSVDAFDRCHFQHFHPDVLRVRSFCWNVGSLGYSRYASWQRVRDSKLHDRDRHQQ